MKCFGLLFWTSALVALLANNNLQGSHAQTQSPTTTSTCGPRIRKSWLALSEHEQTLYKDAIAAAMDSGAYSKFTEMHTEMMSEREAHGQCMFIYWHRLFLVAFENMLRGQGDRFACVTLPYWDWVSDGNRLLSGECTNMLDCSYALRAVGGVSGTTTQSNLTVNGVDTTGVCVASYPLNHFCQASNVHGSDCAKCVTRGTWNDATFPVEASYASVKNQVFGGTNIKEMSGALETGAHNMIHFKLSGAMLTFVSPSDPIFWSHHAMIDLLHTLFHKCRVGTDKMTLAQKAASPVGWTSCERRNSTSAFNPLDKVMMRTGLLGQNPLDGENDPLIGKAFDGVPLQFAALMDHTDLGASSYTYLYQGFLGDWYTNCGATTETTTTTTANTTANTNTTTTAARRRTQSVVDKDALSSAIDATSLAFNSSTLVHDPASNVTSVTTGNLVLMALNASSSAFEPTASAAAVDAQPNSLVIATNTSSSAGSNSIRLIAAVNTTLDDSAQSVDKFTVATTAQLVARFGSNGAESVLVEQEKMACMFQDECLGGVKDYSAEFKKTFGVTEPPRCKAIVDKIRSGEDAIALSDWKQMMVRSFGCPMPTN